MCVDSTELVPVVVTTSHRGVFFGYHTPIEHIPTEIKLLNARMCIYWPSENKGVLGLASDGPLKGSRIGPQVPDILLNNIDAVIGVTAQAVKRWEAQPWL